MSRAQKTPSVFGNGGDESLVANDGTNDIEVLRASPTLATLFLPVKMAAYTVATLPAAAAGLAGARAYVTDANATFTAGIGATVVGGGANKVPVFCDGSAWKIG